MVNIIQFIRLNKQTPVDEVIPLIKGFDTNINTSSNYLVFFQLFKNHYEGLNHRRLVEFEKFINDKMNQMPPVSSVEQTYSKIRGLVKAKYGYDSDQYRASLKYIVFDKATKNKKIQDYNTRIEHDMKHSETIKISTINKLFDDNVACQNHQQMLTYLLISSGSRFDEINNGVFKNAGDGHVFLSNISKTRDKKRIIKKRLLDLNTGKFLRVLKDYRALNKVQESAIIQLNAYLQNKYSITSYSLRKWYANISYELDCPDDTQKQIYLSMVLGHDNLDSAKIYGSFIVEHDEEFKFR